MVVAEVNDALAKRNVALPGLQKLKFKHVCDFEYSDGAKMTTIVGMLVSNADTNRFAKCNFGALDFMPSTGTTVRIEVPLLTIREMRHLERQLPRDPAGKWELGSIPPGHAKWFAAYYRYFPNFAVIEP